MKTTHTKTNLIIYFVAAALLLAFGLAVKESLTVVSLTAPTTMQQMTKGYCADMAVYNGANPGAILTLDDPRNGQSYQVAKLADNNCWMLNNLKITPQDVASAAASLSSPGINNSALAVAASDVPSEDTPKWYDPGGSTNNADPTFYGYLYNWCAATGGTAANCTESNVQPADAATDICPAGWRLPKGGQADDANNEFSQLSAKMAGFSDSQDATYLSDPTAYQDNWLHDGPFKGVFSGGWFNFFGDLDAQGTDALLWSASAYPGYPYLAHYVTFNGSEISVDDYNGLRDYGMAVRCVATGNAAQPLDPGKPGSPATGFSPAANRSY
ncbi:MAG: hypothetical protein LBL84_02875 [Candidatus Nomurabacteria bacterium]|jgi:uncharacterized protein (TIGR02145 family)|nr:hypothetical protein [Candidatus Nomurabacteria bacterium]